MRNKIVLSVVFVLMILLQWFVPSKMIWDREDILKNGKEFLFVCEPIDPNDPFRGKYITLNFKEDKLSIPDSLEYVMGEFVYAKLASDDRGFVMLQSVSKEEPEVMSQILKVSVDWALGDKEGENKTLHVNLPFDRFYMEESKAKPAEDLYRKTGMDTSSVAYAVVMVKDGVGVIKDVMIDGVPIGTMVTD